jgi:predicted nucleotidyltransferase component of viral defense system
MTNEVTKALLNIKDDELFSDAPLYFVGGTALSYYINHRLSYDIDIVSDKKLPFREIQKFAMKIKARIINDSNAWKLRMNSGINSEELVLKYTYNKVKLEFFHPLFDLQNIIIEQSEKYSFEDGNLKILDLKSIAKLKIIALFNRGKSRDYYDVYFLLKHGYIDLEEMTSLWEMMQKYMTMQEHLKNINLDKNDESLDFEKEHEDFKLFKSLNTKEAFLTVKELLLDEIEMQTKTSKKNKDKDIKSSLKKK